MNLSPDEATSLVKDIEAGIEHYPDVDFVICPPFIHIPDIVGGKIPVGGQDCSEYDNGAHTGDISALMLNQAGCSHVILGHSERRQDHNESGPLLSQKVSRAVENDLHVIFCVGETLDQRESGRAVEIVERQLQFVLDKNLDRDKLTIAYEPVWAIGTGKTATVQDITDMHNFIRKKCEESLEDGGQIRILYGGSVKPSNAGDILNIPNVDGALIGGASLKAEDYLAIATFAQNES